MAGEALEQSVLDGTRAQGPEARGGTGWYRHLEMLRASPFPLPLPLLPPSLCLSSRSRPKLRCLGSEERDGPRSPPVPDRCCVPAQGIRVGRPEEVSGGRAREEPGARPALSLGETWFCEGLSSPGLPGPLETHPAADSAAPPPSPPPRPLPRAMESSRPGPAGADGVISGQAGGGVGSKSKRVLRPVRGGRHFGQSPGGRHIPEPLTLEPSGQRGHRGS